MRWLKLGLSLLMAVGQLCGCGRSSTPSAGNATGNAGTGMADASIRPEKVVEPPNALGYSKVRRRTENGDYFEGVVDANGNEIVPLLKQLLVDDITDDMALVRYERKSLFVPLKYGPYSGEDLASVPGFQYAHPYRCGLAMVMLDDDWFYIKPDGQRAFDVVYDFAESFHHDRAYVALGDEHRIIDPTGRIVAVLPYQQVNLQSPYCWQVGNVEDGRYVAGFVDLDGNEISGLVYDAVGYYDADVKRIWVRQGARYGFLNEYGKVAIPIHYEYAEIFDRGKAWVQLNGRQFAIDPDGNEIVDK